MKYILPLLVSFLFTQSPVIAQTKGKINVTIIDTVQKPLEGIMVQLIKTKDSSMTLYAFTGHDGIAGFENVKGDNYRILISQVGYNNYLSSSFNIDSLHEQLMLPAIIMHTQSLLSEVVVEGKTPVIQHYADKTVINVDQSVLNAVGSIYDVLKRSPGIVIDQNENIIMRGKQNVMVMIDDRLMPMSATDLANYLKSLPSEAVDKIELITNPSSKYDANGTAGIINIVLKKNKAIGTNVALNAGYSQGIYPKTNDGFSFNGRTKKFNIFGSYNYAYRGTTNAITLNSNYYNNARLTGSTQQNETLNFPLTTDIARIGTDFFASDKTTVGIILDGGITKSNTSENTTTYQYDSLNKPTGYNITNSTTPNTIYNYSGNLNCKHKFDSAGRELLINLDYANYTNNGYQNVLTNYYNTMNIESSSPSILYGNLPGFLNIYSFKADYDGNLGSNGKLEAGIKTSYVKTDNNIMIYDGANSFAPVDTSQSNHFIYSENINAAYVTYSRSIHKADLQFGLRTEQTIADGDQQTTGQQFSRNFTQVFPTISINDSLTTNNQLGISATRRIDRPTYNQLNPFRIYVNPTFYLQGNPYLIPQNAYSLQVSDTYKENYSLTLSYIHTQNAITTVIFPIPGAQDIAEQTEENLNRFDTYSSNFTAVNQIGKWLNAVISADAYISHYSANLSSSPINSSRFLWDINDNNTITLSKNVSFEIAGNYNSGYDLGYLYLKGSGTVSSGLKINVLQGKGSLKFNVNDIFWTDITRGTTTFIDFNQTINVRRDTRFAGIAFTYHFGNSSASRLSHKGGAEDEKRRASGTA